MDHRNGETEDQASTRKEDETKPEPERSWLVILTDTLQFYADTDNYKDTPPDFPKSPDPTPSKVMLDMGRKATDQLCWIMGNVRHWIEAATMCKTCDGSGIVYTPFSGLDGTCPTCNGRGLIFQEEIEKA